MEGSDLLAMSGLSAGTITIVLIVYRTLKYLKGKRFVSSCCGHKGDIGFDVKDMAPSPTHGTSENKIQVVVENELQQGGIQLRELKASPEGATQGGSEDR